MENRGQRLGGDIDSQEYCEIAVDEAFGLCMQAEDAFREAAKMIGFEDHTLDSLFPLEETYLDILGEGLDEDKCSSISDLSKWIVCRAWQMYQEGETKSVVTAFRMAWREFREECGGMA